MLLETYTLCLAWPQSDPMLIEFQLFVAPTGISRPIVWPQMQQCHRKRVLFASMILSIRRVPQLRKAVVIALRQDLLACEHENNKTGQAR